MTPDELKDYLRQTGTVFEEREIQAGIQLRCTRGGEVFNVYRTGRATVGGTRTDLSGVIQAWINSGARPAETISPTPLATAVVGGAQKTVFIVHGHDTIARDALELQIRRFGLNPIILQSLPASGDTIIEKLEQYLGARGNVGYACVLLTPDDEGHRNGAAGEKKYRARQNVILELGMVLAKLGRPRVAILHKETVELPSDIAGLIYIPYKERVDEIRHKLFQALEAANCGPSPSGL